MRGLAVALAVALAAASCSNEAPTGPTGQAPAGAGDSGSLGPGGLDSGGAAKDCDDGNACTTDSCDASGGCVNTPEDNGEAELYGNGTDDPDDEAKGGKITVTFNQAMFFYGLYLIDVEEDGGCIVVHHNNGTTETYAIPGKGNNSKQAFFLNKGGVVKMEFKLKGFGAIDDLCFCPNPQCAAAAEVCDGMDNDCDLQADEGDVCGGGSTGTETAWAYGAGDSTCLNQLPNINSNKWGWANGPMGAGTYSWDIYAAAGQCDLSKGTKVGALSVQYNGSTAVVTYTMDSGYTMSETHLHVGSDPLPKKGNGQYTEALGQFGHTDGSLGNASSDTYTVSGLSGNIYVSAHAVVTGGG